MNPREPRRLSEAMMGAHLRLEHGWSWEKIKKAFHVPYGDPWSRVRERIEFEMERMGE